MRNPRPHTAARVALALVAVMAVVWGSTLAAVLDETGTAAGTSITNRAEATYTDARGQSFGTVSETVTLQVRAVSAVVVTPDETEPSATVSPNERVTRLFRVCNAGNTPDFHTLTRAEVNAPAVISGLFYDTDASGTLTPGDRPAQVSVGLGPRLQPRSCFNLIVVVDTNQSAPGSRLTIGVTARSNVAEAAGGMAQDDGTIVNHVGNGARISSPDDPNLPPVKLVEARERVTAAHGQTLTYTVLFRNSGDVPARNAVLSDELPHGLDYVSGSLRLNNRALTDADDGDEGRVRGRRIEVRWSEVAVGDLVEIVFRARVMPNVQPGAAVVNTATISADNAPAVASSAALAVVNPFGLVYEARSNGSVTVSGARVALLRDQTVGAQVELAREQGSAPNERNDNPFLSDSQGRWSFVLSPEQLGNVGGTARYFLNVTAEGFRARMIEVVVTPSAAAPGLFSLTVRSADGMPVAQSGSFELTEESVLMENLAAFALNVPMFERQAVEIAKSADRSSVEVGDVVSYRVEVHNATSVVLNDVTVRDVLPPSFHYAAGTARVEVPPAAARSVEPESIGDALVFRVGQLRANERAVVSYRVRVGANARDGEQFNTAVADGVFLSGERVSTNPTRAAVRVRRGLFSTQQIILGRVFEDANGNGRFDEGEKAVEGVRLYLNNGQSVVTDSAGQYNFPSVNDGALVISIDPVTVPAGYALVPDGTRDSESYTRLLRTPLGGGSLLRQNFALRATRGDGTTAGRADEATKKGALAWGSQENALKSSGRTSSASNEAAPSSPNTSSGDGAPPSSNTSVPSSNTSVPSSQPPAASSSRGDGPTTLQPVAASARPRVPASETLTSGTYTVAATETIEPLAAGAVRIVSPASDEVVGGAALEVEAQVAEGWTVALEVEGSRVEDSRIGTRRVDHKNKVTTYSFVGINLRPGPNRVRATAVGPAGESRETTEVVVYGRGPAKRLELTPDKTQLSAGGRDSTLVRVRAFDQWNHPAADTAVAVETTSGRFVVREDKSGVATQTNDEKKSSVSLNAGEPTASEGGTTSGSQQVVQLSGGEGALVLVADNQIGAADIRATTGTLAAQTSVRITPEIRPSIMVGLAEISVGRGAPEMELRGEDEAWRSRIGFFYRGRIFGSNLLTLAYDSERPLNRTAGRDRLFTLDPLERAYPLFGDSSTRFEDAQSNSKLYARLDRGRSYFLFGDFETEHRNLALSGYARKLTGVKVHLENESGDFVSLTGARPDTSYARDVFPGGGLSLVSLSHADVLPGSEVVVLEVRDRRNPERIISRESFVRSVDYNLDTTTGQLFFLRHVSTFDYALNLVQIVVTYEHRATGMSSAVYTGRAVKTFKKAGLRVGVSLVDQKQAEAGSFVLGGLDGEKKMPNGGTLQFEYATSRGQAAFSGNLFTSDAVGDTKHNGNAYRVEYEQPLPFLESRLRAGYARADEGFLNPFGATVTPGSQRTHVELDVKVRASSMLTLGFMDERNRTAGVNNRRQTGSLSWTERWTDRFRTVFGYDFRRYRDELGGRGTDSNLVTVGAEWQATDKLSLSVQREQNLGEADPTYPNQTTLTAAYQYNQFTRVFLTQRLASAPIMPISDASMTGFAASGARRETAIGVETRLGRNTNLVSRYQLENGINGTDSFAVIGLQNRLPLSERLAIEMGYERGFHLAGLGESFNSATLGVGWQPTENFRTSARYEWRDRLGSGHIFTFGAAGRLSDNLTALARYQSARASFEGRRNRSTTASAAVAWRPVTHDRYGLLFSYTRRDLFNEGFAGSNGATRDLADVLSADGYYQVARDLELYGRFASKFGHSGTPELANVSTFTYLAQGRATYRFGRYVDLAGEMRLLAQPASATRRTSYGAELGFWVTPDLRVGGGYNFTDATEPNASGLNLGRRGFYFVLSSKLSRLFDLFGTSEAQDSDKSAAPAPTATPTNGGENR